MGLFQPAKAVERKLKVLAYGPPGVGKTFFALSFQEAGKVAVIDTEGGTALYGGRFDFDVVRTKDFAEVLRAVAEVKTSRQYTTLVIDPITVLWSTLQDAGQALAERRANKSSASGVTGVTLTQLDWGIIKRQYNKLMTELVNLPMHVVITAREKDIIGADDKRQGTRPDAEKSTPYLPDIILHFEGAANGVYCAKVEKDRSGLYKLGQIIENPRYASFAKAVSTGVAAPLQDDDAATAATAALLEQAEQPAPAQSSETAQVAAIIAELGVEAATLAKWGARQGIGTKSKDLLSALRHPSYRLSLWAMQKDISMTTVDAYMRREDISPDAMIKAIHSPDVLESLRELTAVSA